MNKASKNSKKLKKARIRSLISKAHVLIAVVAIIECLILISITTYSWIETASSLIIKTGHKNYEDSFDTRIPIANAFNYKFTINNTTPNMSDVADLNNYFDLSGESSTQNLFRFARASSANGKDFFFPKKNNLNSTTAYRKGDIIDSNSNFVHYDFTLSNKGAAKDHKFKFYFNDADVFNVSNGSGSLTENQLNQLKYAMRISFQTGNGTPKIYAMTDGSAETVSSTAVNTTGGGTTGVTVTKIKSDQNQKLFTIGKESEQNISVRIWLEDKATTLTAQQIAGVNITVNLQLTYAQNDYDFLYFDDYTFSSGIKNKLNIGGHLTEDFPESDNYRMYFVYRESSTSSGSVYPMTRDTSGSNVDANCWVTCDTSGTPASSVPDITSQPYISNLTTANHSALTYSYFAYGKCPVSLVNNSITLTTYCNALYTWKLNATPASGTSELRYSAYSMTKTSATETTTPNGCTGFGAGGWSYTTPLERVYFRDLATGVTDGAYNAGNNFRYITASANIGSDDDGSTTTHRANVVYLNQNSATSYTETVARQTAALYYDKTADNGKGLFTSWVPSSWLSGTSYFRYCPNGYYNNTTNAYCAVRWTAPAATHPSNNSNAIYTALGYSDRNTISAYSTTIALASDGVGCWNAIESQPVYFSTELIDNDVTSAKRYKIGVKINNSSTVSYYSLVPDETNTKFYAYIPVPGTNATPASDYADGAILFKSYTTYNTSANDGKWWGRVRNGSRTYYPVLFSASDGSSSTPKGYWNLAVIVDGTYEHFFWDEGDVSTHDDDDVLGTFEYNTTGHSGTPTYTNITPNMIDEYRWYVPFDITSVGTMPESVYFKWEPYTGTVFKYSHYRSEGIYCVITESANAVPDE